MDAHMDLQLKGKTALVTGASQGLGRAIAVGLAMEGVQVAITVRRRELLEKVAAEIVQKGGLQPLIIVADLYPENASDDIAARRLHFGQRYRGGRCRTLLRILRLNVSICFYYVF